LLSRFIASLVAKGRISLAVGHKGVSNRSLAQRDTVADALGPANSTWRGRHRGAGSMRISLHKPTMSPV
jgi:hypothetical protein